uniref:oligodendrocyte-myelin glycoprotein-like n=1 Tax=Scatophagus argus TaxID=75038 RepID=UPI001ED805B2|nr:oligodendrocyte-myelin glycoprotein-like [Scatophagus argus]
MRSRHVLLKLPPNETLLELLLVLLLGVQVLAVCPSVCSCSRSHREVDCSWRGLRQLPDGLQHNMLSLNLSHNRFHNLDGQLTSYTHLRFLDLSHNRLSHLPTSLPRSLWHLYATYNRLQLLDKNDTVYQWNLRMLDLSNNRLERAIFINNTLINLCMLNLSHNHFWTLPTNMPANLETIDLSHNLLVKVLPGSLNKLLKLTHFYLHANRFSMLPFGVLDKLTSLRLITLDNNPWACHLNADITYLVSWTQQTPAHVLGCPCHTQPVCGGVRPGRTGGWHFASYNQPPMAASAQDLNSMHSPTSITEWWYSSVSSLLSTPHNHIETWRTSRHTSTATPISISTLLPRSIDTHLTISHVSESDSPSAAERMFHTDSHLISDTKEASARDSLHTIQSPFTDTNFITQTPTVADTTLATDPFLTTESSSIQTKKTTTLRTRSVRRQNQSLPSGVSNSSPALATCSLLPLLNKLGLLSLLLQQIR